MDGNCLINNNRKMPNILHSQIPQNVFLFGYFCVFTCQYTGPLIIPVKFGKDPVSSVRGDVFVIILMYDR